MLGDVVRRMAGIEFPAYCVAATLQILARRRGYQVPVVAQAPEAWT